MYITIGIYVGAATIIFILSIWIMAFKNWAIDFIHDNNKSFAEYFAKEMFSPMCMEEVGILTLFWLMVAVVVVIAWLPALIVGITIGILYLMRYLVRLNKKIEEVRK